MNNTTVLVTAVVLVAALHTGVSLKCYDCNNTQQECKDPFNRTLAGNALVEVQRDYVCTKIVNVKGKEKFINRHMKPKKDAIEECGKRIYRRGSDSCSWCDDRDGCNTAARPVESLYRTLIHLTVPCIIALIIAS